MNVVQWMQTSVKPAALSVALIAPKADESFDSRKERIAWTEALSISLRYESVQRQSWSRCQQRLLVPVTDFYPVWEVVLGIQPEAEY